MATRKAPAAAKPPDTPSPPDDPGNANPPPFTEDVAPSGFVTVSTDLYEAVNDQWVEVPLPGTNKTTKVLVAAKGQRMTEDQLRRYADYDRS